MAIGERTGIPILAEGIMAFLPGDVAAGIQNHTAGLVISYVVIECAASVGREQALTQIDVLVGQSAVGVLRDIFIAIKKVNGCSSTRNLHCANAGSSIRIGARAWTASRANDPVFGVVGKDIDGIVGDVSICVVGIARRRDPIVRWVNNHRI